MKQATLVLVFDDKENIVLCMKKRWFWSWLYNWAGWKVEAWETILEAASRELMEETTIDIKPEWLTPRWVFHFFFLEKPEWNMDVHLFTAHNYTWDFEETEEMKPELFKISEIPFEKMWPDDAIWMPRVIAWENVEYDFSFDNNWQIVEYTQIK